MELLWLRGVVARPGRHDGEAVNGGVGYYFGGTRGTTPRFLDRGERCSQRWLVDMPARSTRSAADFRGAVLVARTETGFKQEQAAAISGQPRVVVPLGCPIFKGCRRTLGNGSLDRVLFSDASRIALL